MWEGQNVVFRQKFICGDSPASRGIVMVQDPITGTSILRAVCAQRHRGVAELFCRIPYLLSVSRDALMMNQPVSVEERNQHGLDIGFHLPCFLWSR